MWETEKEIVTLCVCPSLPRRTSSREFNSLGQSSKIVFSFKSPTTGKRTGSLLINTRPSLVACLIADILEAEWLFTVNESNYQTK